MEGARVRAKSEGVGVGVAAAAASARARAGPTCANRPVAIMYARRRRV